MKILPKSARARILLLGLVLWASACDSDTTSFDHRFPLTTEHGHDLYFANGYGGQFIVVVPDLDLVVVASSWWVGIGWDAAGEQWYTVISLIMEGIVPLAE